MIDWLPIVLGIALAGSLLFNLAFVYVVARYERRVQRLESPASPHRARIAWCTVEGCDRAFAEREEAYEHARRVHRAPDQAAADHILTFDL